LQEFKATIKIIGVNPYVLLPKGVLNHIFKESGKDHGKIPVKLKIEGHDFIQTLIKYSGHWRLYLNTPMRKAAQKKVGESANFSIGYDPAPRIILMPEKFKQALRKNRIAKKTFDNLSPSRQKEITRYIANLKSEESVLRNIARAIGFLLGKERFIGTAPAAEKK
jgi:Bacteriocin-protection, YdeI or OmpD-Associated/Domain of unknown function (DUF1905)